MKGLEQAGTVHPSLVVSSKFSSYGRKCLYKLGVRMLICEGFGAGG